MTTFKVAFDSTARSVDADGRLHIARSHISKATVNPYYGKEIPGYQDLGLLEDKIYRLFRDPIELEKAASSFARLPILSEHVPVTVDTPRPDLIVGAIGSDIVFDSPYLDADLCFWDSSAIAGIETEKIRELSCAYRYIPIMESGEFEGQPFDGRMTEIKGNHLALVAVGRAGSDVIVADANPFTFKEKTEMKMTKLGKALFAALSAASPVLAADSALPALVGNANRKTLNKADVAAKLIALDATLSPQQLDNVIDALLDVEQDEPEAIKPLMPATDASPAEKLRSLLAGKVDDALIDEACALFENGAIDEKTDYEPGMKEEEVKAAMDSMSAKLRKEMREAAEAARDVRPIVGDVIGMDSAADVYGFALDHLKVDRKDVTGVAALRALFKVASEKSMEKPAVIAQDAQSMIDKFPQAARFKKA